MARPQTLTVGMPRALLYHRYAVLWQTYFDALGIATVVSEETNREIAEGGIAAATDEMCLSLKVYLGHVAALIGKCDRIFIPRIVDFGIRRVMCTTFEGLPDIAANIFRDRHITGLFEKGSEAGLQAGPRGPARRRRGRGRCGGPIVQK